ncbi:zincin [Cylindrobasidium torrendii FP15055 ss-10]|uniref:Zincin n=1 Tax=Cylindrobasidium torrendii FP15055 ss-10 TaxID=1314674 RepID=A0A0D7BI70_9AGAR|nr:zincin [Cylindrobasidium torrendii FP15055 ss-10]
MFSSTSSIIVFALGLATSASAGLTLSLSGADAVHDVSTFAVDATLTNTGPDALKLLRDPHTLLSAFPGSAKKFHVRNSEGQSPEFNGAFVKYSSEVAKSRHSAVKVLQPGESITVTHNLGRSYNFTSTGESEYDVHPKTSFSVVDSDGQVKTVNATVVNTDAKLQTRIVGGRLVLPRDYNGMRRRAGYNECSSDEKDLIDAGIKAAQKYAQNASIYLNKTTKATPRFETWFGKYSTAHHKNVTTHFNNMLKHPYKSYTYDCTPCEDDLADAFAYVYPDEISTIHLCGSFWTANATGTDSRGGTLVHESSHFTLIAGTDDHAYGHELAKELALNNTAFAIMNADSHEYFAENDPALK